MLSLSSVLCVRVQVKDHGGMLPNHTMSPSNPTALLYCTLMLLLVLSPVSSAGQAAQNFDSQMPQTSNLDEIKNNQLSHNIHLTSRRSSCAANEVCTDQTDWVNTAWYGCTDGYLSTTDCDTYGSDADVNGVLPATACCICGGGTCVAGSSATATLVIQDFTLIITG